MTENSSGRARFLPRLISVAALVAVPLVALDPWFSTVATQDRDERVAALRGVADAPDPEFVAFLRRVSDRLETGAPIILVVTPDASAPPYAWYVYRAEWVLAGREIHPLFDPQTKRRRAPIEHDSLVVFWNARPDPSSFQILEQEGRGTLARKRS